MAVSEPDRHELFERLEEVIGKKPTETMMALLPPVGWADVATKQDLEYLRAATKQDLEHLRAATQQDIEYLKQDVEHFRALNKSEHEVMESRLNAQIMRTALTVNIPAVLAGVGLAFAAARLT
ncbi:MAG: hypothetical protein ACRDH6_03930 [Actinomycetota bacterium]